jgi:hypothetical protein
LSAKQREDLIAQLRPAAGHKTKLSAFFTVIDEIYPRQKVIDEIKSVTPDQTRPQITKKVGMYGDVQSKVSSRRQPSDVQIKVAPQKTLL